jgi:hypothetical protein
MKTRNGFVSNSSSASYIVKIKDINFEEFCERIMREYQWYELNMKQTLGKIKKRIYQLHESSKASKVRDKQEEPTDQWYARYMKELEALFEEGSKIDEDNIIDVVKFILEYNDIKLSLVTNGIELDYFTSMHNCYNEGVSDLLKEIVLFFSFETDYEIKFEVEHK